MNKKKRSSIEYLSHELNSLHWDYIVGVINSKEHNERYYKIFEQAKVMHMKEMEESYWESLISKYQSFEHYYEENFNTNLSK